MVPSVTLTLTNLFIFISLLSPLFVIFFTILTSIINNDLLKGLILNMGVVLVSGIIYLLKTILKNKQDPHASPFCNFLPAPFTVRFEDSVYNNPSLSTGILSFVTTYLIYPMIINNQLNPGILLFLISITAINIGVENHLKCSNISSGILGILVGMIFAMIYYTILRLNNNDSLVYFTQKISNNIQCSKPENNRFKCQVYKNGVPLN